jgi:predicted DNA-binding transcriptional regulator AlpA
MPGVLDEFIDEFELAEQLGLTVRTLREYRKRGVAPPWTEIGRTVRYHAPSIPKWLESRLHKPVRSLTERKPARSTAA